MRLLKTRLRLIRWREAYFDAWERADDAVDRRYAIWSLKRREGMVFSLWRFVFFAFAPIEHLKSRDGLRFRKYRVKGITRTTTRPYKPREEKLLVYGPTQSRHSYAELRQP